MTGRVQKLVAWALLTGACAAIASLVRPGDRALALDAYLLFLGSLSLLLLARATATALPKAGRSGLEQALRRPGRAPSRPSALTALERKVLLAGETAFEAHYRLRPILREIATYRLSSRRGIELDGDLEAARAVLGPEAWDLVRPDREPPSDRFGPGHPVADLTAAVEALESI